jgi:putative PIN family toxin of toxin-antitoxin system
MTPTTPTPDARYVFDTNVLISALLFSKSTPDQAVAAAVERGTVLVSLPLLQELQRVLSRSKFDRYVTQIEREQFLAALTLEATLIEVTVSLQVCRDPKDDMILELAVSGQATCVISGDDDLLALDPFQGIRIRTPTDFLADINR